MQALLFLLCVLVFIDPVQAEYLQGGVQHSEYLPKMPPQLQAGNRYQEMQGQPTSIVWYPLPKWLAGKYQSDYITNQVTEVYSSAAQPHSPYGKMKHIENFGLQLDSTGRVWHADFLPHIALWQGNRTEVQTTIAKQCVTSNENTLVLRIHNHCVFLNPSTQRIVYAEQVEGYKTITLMNQNGDLSIWDDIKEYDCSGAPIDRYVARSAMHRTEAFSPMSSENGIDLQSSLAQYLTSINRQDLLPGGFSAAVPKREEALPLIPTTKLDPTQVSF